LNVLDFSDCPDITELAKMVKVVASISHTGAEVGNIISPPVKFDGQTYSQTIKNSRAVEDALFKNALDIMSDLSVHYNVEHRHASDKRIRFSKCYFALSEKVGGGSDWYNSEVFSTHGGKIENVDMCRVKDMHAKVNGFGPVEAHIGPQDAWHYKVL
jgi:hypothetical protein